MSKREDNWFKNYDAACAYKRKYGNLDIPRKYITTNGIKLGYWLETQRCAKRGTGNWKISNKEISLLTKLGIDWGEEKTNTVNLSNHESTKKKNMEFMSFARKFYEEHGNLDFPKGTKECAWLDSLRWSASCREDKSKAPISSEDLNGRLSKKNIEELTSMGMEWNTRNYNLVEKRLQAIEEYKEKNGTANVPVSYVNEKNEKIGLWVARQRNNKRGTTQGVLTSELEQELSKLGLEWNPMLSKKIEDIEEWYSQHGNLNIPMGLNNRLGEWVEEKRIQEKNGNGNKILKEILETIGVDWP